MNCVKGKRQWIFCEQTVKKGEEKMRRKRRDTEISSYGEKDIRNYADITMRR
jgi:hypothetical protein